MTEEEWLANEDPAPMLELLSRNGSRRKFIMLCKQWYLVSGKTDWKRKPNPMWDVAEQFAEGTASVSQLNAYWLAPNATSTASWPQRPFEWAMSVTSPEYPANLGFRDVPPQGRELLPIASSLLRDIFGNPFRPVAVDPRWLTETVITLAEGVYQQRAFDRMPILADALEEAGCDNADILTHCRQAGEHVRGCWVVDLLTGRK